MSARVSLCEGIAADRDRQGAEVFAPRQWWRVKKGLLTVESEGRNRPPSHEKQIPHPVAQVRDDTHPALGFQRCPNRLAPTGIYAWRAARAAQRHIGSLRL